MFECLLCLRRACSDTKDTLKAYHSATRRLLKKKIHFGVLSDFCASSVLTLLLAETKAHPRLCFVKRNDAFYRMESKEEKFHPTVCMFKLHKQHRNLLDNI